MSAQERDHPALDAWSAAAAGSTAAPRAARPRQDFRTDVPLRPAEPWVGAEMPAGARERRLVLAAQRGEPSAVRELYESYRERIWALILISIGDAQQAQDVLQTVFFKVFRGLGSFRFESSLFTWIYRIARNECWNHRRRRREPHVSLESILGSRDEMDPNLLTGGPDAIADRDRLLEQAVMGLPFKMREVVVLKYREGLSYDEMSRALGCAPGTVASRLNRALAELEERLRPLRGRL
ncbi:MAG: sigma-70 family RNA polymerase sigma factor [Candidatus Aminicenantales bacterium]